MTYDELVLRSIGAAFSGDFTAAFGLSEKRGDLRKPEPDDPIDTSDTDEAEADYERGKAEYENGAFVDFAEQEKELRDEDEPTDAA